jgi:hypothetical protein
MDIIGTATIYNQNIHVPHGLKLVSAFVNRYNIGDQMDLEQLCLWFRGQSSTAVIEHSPFGNTWWLDRGPGRFPPEV